MSMAENIIKNALEIASTRVTKKLYVGMLEVFKKHNVISQFSISDTDDVTIVTEDEELLTVLLVDDDRLRVYVIENYPQCAEEIDDVYSNFNRLLEIEMKRMLGNRVKTSSEILNMNDN